MTRNDTFFKILFAIEIALVPLVMSAYILMPEWTVGVFIAGILVAKIWLELFKNKQNRTHNLIMAMGNIVTISALVIFFTIHNYISVFMCVVVVSLVFLMNVLRVALRKDIMPEMIDAVDSCYTLFECLTLIVLAFITFYVLTTNIALFALMLTSGVSVLYKLYYVLKHKDGLTKIKNLFRRK